jgi:hypothetical protein
MQIEPRFDPMEAALQSFCVGAVDPGETIERRHLRRPRQGRFRSHRRNGDDRARASRGHGPLAAQRPHIANRFYP